MGDKRSNYERGKYHCTIDLLFDWFGLDCFANKNKKLSVVIQLIPNLSNRRSTVQWYFPFSIPWMTPSVFLPISDAQFTKFYTLNFYNINFSKIKQNLGCLIDPILKCPILHSGGQYCLNFMCLQLKNGCNKLKCLSLASFFSLA